MVELTYCGTQARLFDYDRYLCSLFAPQNKQAYLWAILAFHSEIAEIKNKIQEPMMGQIRLQWWRDRLNQYPNWQTTPHPVLTELAPAIAASQLPLALFHQLIDAHETDFDPHPFPDDQAFKNDSRETNLPVLKLLAQILKLDDSGPDFLDSLALAWGMINLWRSIPSAVQKGSCPIPLTWLKTVELSPETILSGTQEKHRSLGHIFLDNLKPIMERLPKRKRETPAFLPVSLQCDVVNLYYQRFLRYDANLRQVKLYQKPPLLSWRLLLRRKLR